MANNAGNNVTTRNDLILMALQRFTSPYVMNKNEKITNDTCIADTGASCHMMNNDTSMYDDTMLKDNFVTVADDQDDKALKIGKLDVTAIQENGDKVKFTMEIMKYCPELAVKLFSLTAAIDNGANLRNKG